MYVKLSLSSIEQSLTRIQGAHTVRLVLPSGQTSFMQASTAQEMDEWIALVNYTSALKTSGWALDWSDVGNRVPQLPLRGSRASENNEALSVSNNVCLTESSSSDAQNTLVSWSDKVEKIGRELSAQQRDVRCLGILSPFQRSSRDRLAAAIPALAHNIRRDRLQITKFHTWISIMTRITDALPGGPLGQLSPPSQTPLGDRTEGSSKGDPQSGDVPMLSVASPEPEASSSTDGS